MTRSKSSQNISATESPPSPLPPRQQIYDDLGRTSKSRQSAGSIGNYDTVYIRERRGRLDSTDL